MLVSLRWLQDLITGHLPEAAEVARVLTARGLTVDAVRPIDDDAVFDVDVPANRPDALGHVGMAREVAAGLGLSLRPRPAPAAGSGDEIGGAVRVRVDDAERCARYTARLVRGVAVGPSPAWVVRRLESCGLRSINNVVDISNLVMLETGHPNHTFDLALVRGAIIVVRRAQRGETLVTLDGVTRKLDPDMLVIADGEGPTAIAGVMGGALSEIRATTRDVLIEAAWFLPSAVRATARRLGMSTDASQRFERGADPEATLAAQEMCLRLLAEICGGRPAPGLIDVNAVPRVRPTLQLRAARVAHLLGYAPAPEEIHRALAAVGLAPRDAAPGIIEVTVPSWRVDLEREVDLIEEVARHLGYDRIPEAEPTAFPARTAAAAQPADERARDLLASHGFHEAFNYAMIGPGDDDAFVPAGTPASMTLSNPLAEPLGVLRRSVLPGLIRASAGNLRRGVDHARLFEVGKVFLAQGQGFPVEPLRLGFVWSGAATPPHWTHTSRTVDFWDAIGLAQAVIQAFRPGARVTAAPGDLSGFQPGQRAVLHTEAGPAAWCGVVDSALGRALDAPAAILAGEVDLDVIARIPERPPRYVPLPRVPGSERDLAVVVGSATSAAQVLETLAAVPAPAPARFDVVDRYVGPPLEAGESSLTVRVILQPLERTLTDAETEDFRTRLVAALGKLPGVRLRG